MQTETLFPELASKFADSCELAKKLDEQDPLRYARSLFHIPLKKDIDPEERSLGSPPLEGESIYLTGNSLGLQPKSLEATLQKELENWKKWGVCAHFRGDHPWVSIDEVPLVHMAELVGGQVGEVAVMGALSANIHLMMVPFYKPNAKRHKIIIEKGAFPSDLYVVTSQIEYHGFKVETSLVQLVPREGEHTLRTQDIIETIQQHGPELALILLPGVQYYTGQLLDMKTLTEAAHSVGAYAGWDLAHAAGNVFLDLHNWGVDFACWCSYKYLNSGPGGIGGLFIHSKHDKEQLPRFGAWWGHDSATRFNMDRPFSPISGAFGFRQSNPSVLTTMALAASLQIFHDVGMSKFLEKQKKLTGYLELLLKEKCKQVTIISPKSPAERGCQLSIVCPQSLNPHELETRLFREGVVCDVRSNVIRAAPSPFYNSFSDVRDFVLILDKLTK